MVQIYSIKDCKVGCFFKPFTEKSDIDAKRGLSYIVNNTDSPISNFPEDFELYCHGEFNEGNGELKAYASPVYVASAYHYKKSSTPNNPESEETK
jgi:hypothetical protein